MRARHHDGAVAPGPVTPTSDNARWQAGASEAGDKSESPDCAAKLIAAAVARAALLGIEVHRLADGSWLLRHASGAGIGVGHGLDALAAAVGGFERAVDDARRLLESLRRPA